MASETDKRRNMLSTFGGVFTPSILTILGAIMFLRASFVVGHAGILNALAILLLAKSITLLTSLSVSAVSTNIRVKGGGAYFMISRVMGPEFGGSIGIALYFAQALSVPFYILAFTEAITSTFPALQPWSLTLMLLAALILFGVSYVGAAWAIKTQYAIMAILAVAIFAFMGGALTRVAPETFHANLHASGDASYPFWIVFAIYFPAVTGILAGINMSGDLADPVKSIPRGTFLAIAVGFAVYAAQVLIVGSAFPRRELIERPYAILESNALFGAGFLVAAGVTAATLSSALGSYLGAPRILQALARDKILPMIGGFAAGSRHGDEPRRGLVLTGVVTAIVLCIAHGVGTRALNTVAGVITMFFLYTYGMINLAAFIEGLGDNPSFRPRFRYFHWITALLGTGGCVGAALLVDAGASVAAIVVIGLLYLYIARRQLKANFGDARRGYVFTRARHHLVQLSGMAEDPRNWRPTVLAFSGNPNAREALVTYSAWLEGGRGIVYLANILAGTIEEHAPRRRAATRQLEEFCRERELHAFPIVAVADDVDQGIKMLLQTTSPGPLSPNLAVFGWSPAPANLDAYVGYIRIAHSLGMSSVLLGMPTGSAPSPQPRIDVWWRGQQNGGLMVLLAYLLQQNWEWKRGTLRILRVVQNEAGREPAQAALEALIHDARVTASPVCLVDDRPFADILREHSADADCVFLGFEIPPEARCTEWHAIYGRMIRDMPPTILVNSSGREDLMA